MPPLMRDTKTRLSRRRLLAALGLGPVAAAGLPVLYGGQARAAVGPARERVGVVIPQSYKPLSGGSEQKHVARLSRATLGFLKRAYGGRRMPIWNKKPEQVNMEIRVRNIALWVVRAVDANQDLYPVDPAWILGQIMAESFFYEFAVSPAFAVGICQFIPSTARKYGMLVAGDKEEHSFAPYKRTDLADAHQRYLDARTERARLRRSHPVLENPDDLKELLRDAAAGKRHEEIEALLEAEDEIEQTQQAIRQARKDYATYLQANFEDRNIFVRADIRFLKTLDERVSYKAPTNSMVKMMAESLRARHGNIMAATGAYNAGLGRTRETGVYRPYGRLPAIPETVRYVSRIFINHHEIVRRLG